jgi:hypothetical protein
MEELMFSGMYVLNVYAPFPLQHKISAVNARLIWELLHTTTNQIILHCEAKVMVFFSLLIKCIHYWISLHQ